MRPRMCEYKDEIGYSEFEEAVNRLSCFDMRNVEEYPVDQVLETMAELNNCVVKARVFLHGIESHTPIHKCPFCGSTRPEVQDRMHERYECKVYRVHCKECRAAAKECVSKIEAVLTWNEMCECMEAVE